MLSGLSFEISAAASTTPVQRADVCCFIGYVARRRGALPDAVRGALHRDGWVQGPWQLGDERLESLTQVPVTIDSWDQFDALFAWEQRALRAGQAATCASYLGAAVRNFFVHGGRRAVVVRVADPWPYIESDNRVARRIRRLAHLVPSVEADAAPLDTQDPRRWRGIEHLCALEGVSLLCLPDLADACARESLPLSAVNPPSPVAEGFVECSEDEPGLEEDRPLRFTAAPRTDEAGYRAWAGAIDRVREFLAARRRDVVLLATPPLPEPDARIASAAGVYAGRDWLAFLRGSSVLEAEGRNEAGNGTGTSALVQLAWPWLRTSASQDLPQGLMPSDAVLAGQLAGNALARGTYRSLGGTRIDGVLALEPPTATGEGGGSPAARLAQRVCLAGETSEGVVWLSDVTSSPDPAWRAGPVSRLMANLIRVARVTAEAQLFEANGEVTWTRVRRAIESLLEDWRREGALESRPPHAAYTVRCGRETLNQNDLDNGRLRVEVTVCPVGAVEHITVSFDMAGASAATSLREVA